MKYPCEEITFETNIDEARVRLWINAEKFVMTIPPIPDNVRGRKNMAVWYAENIEGINAVQVIDKGLGYMIYTFEDKD